MSHKVISAVIRGSRGWYEEADKKLSAAIKDKGETAAVAFPDTAFYLPMAYALLGIEAKTLGDCRTILEECRAILPEVPTNRLWLPYLGDGLDGGIVTLLSQEVIGALRYFNKEPVEQGYYGFLSDVKLRELGIQLVDGRMPGAAALLGPAPDNKTAVKVIRELQKRSLLIFLMANRNGRSMRDQLAEENIEMGWDTYIVPVGRDTLSGIYILDWAIRGALTFGGHKKGEFEKCLRYCRERIFAFGMTFGPIPDDWFGFGAGAIAMGFPVISDDRSTDEVHPTGVTTYEALIVEPDYDKIVPRAVEVRGVQVKVAQINIPVPYAAAFEGERVRKEDMHVQFGSKYSKGVEFLRMRKPEEVEDGKVEVFGPDIDTAKEGGAMDLAVVVEVSGRKMKPDFEGILERQIHRYINHAMGVMHIAQRDQVWIRISKETFKGGFRLKHFGVILHARLHEEYGGIVDKVQVKIYTKPEDVARILAESSPVFDARDARVAGMTDESVDTFYSCTICQSYAPNHVCVITPERLGLCGAYNWLDGQAAYEINPTGRNQPIKKGRVIEQRLGEWEGVNQFVNAKSNRTVEHFCAYSIMQNPMTSCGCFECMIAIVPEANGVIAVNREYTGETPIGMTFGALAGSVGGGAQTPGFVGVGRLYLTSRKFISAEGGLPRLVWLPKELKDAMRPRLEARAKEIGMPDLVDKIADETVAKDVQSLLEHLQKVNHPVLKMDPLL